MEHDVIQKLEPMATERHHAPFYRLLADAIGPLPGVAGKARRLAAILAEYGHGAELDARLARLQARGLIDAIPTRLQLVVGSIDMVRFWISPAAADYYRSQGIDFTFHQILRFLDEPASMADPVGFFSDPDNIIGHLMQVVHANPLYDLQLLDFHDGGVESLCTQLAQMIAGTHPRSQSIGAIVEEPDYHQRLLTFVRAWQRDRSTPPVLRSNIAENPAYRELEATFGSLTEAMRYFCRMPTTVAAAMRYLLTTHRFPSHLSALANRN